MDHRHLKKHRVFGQYANLAGWFILFCAAICVILLNGLAIANTATPAAMDAESLGKKVLAIEAALADPTAHGSLQAVRDLGLDSRYYVMVRGWLGLQLEGDRSIAAAANGPISEDNEQRIEFLERAIRAIDLE